MSTVYTGFDDNERFVRHEYPECWHEVLIRAVVNHKLYYDAHDLINRGWLSHRIYREANFDWRLTTNWGSVDDSYVSEPDGEYQKEAERFAKYFRLRLTTGEKPLWNKRYTRYRFTYYLSDQIPDTTVPVLMELVRNAKLQLAKTKELEKQLEKNYDAWN